MSTLGSTTKLNVIVAACNNMGIGIEGRLPWRLKQDMAFFKKITTTTQNTAKKNVVIMGKNTWLSIPAKFRPLSDRINIILSTQLQEKPQGAYLVSSFEKAMELISSLHKDVESVFVIGGASVYKEAMQMPNPCRIFFTRVHSSFSCDTFFPDIDDNIFKRLSTTDQQSIVLPETFQENGIQFSFEIYDKSV